MPVFIALAAGAVAALALPGGAVPWFAAGAVAAWQLASVALAGGRAAICAGGALASLALSAAASAQHVDWQRAHMPIRALAPPAHARAGSAEPAWIEGVLAEDAAAGDEGTTMKVRVDTVRASAGVVEARGTVLISVAGAPDAAAARAWTRGRRIRAPVTLRRQSRYLNDGVADAERASMRRGVSLAGTVKSPALVEVIARAGPWPEALAAARRRVRDAIARACGPDARTAAVVTAILIGDRTGLERDVERRMQRAGTYHVSAISGGNVALFAALAWGASRLLLRSRRLALVAAMLMVALYGALVGSGASVGRAVAAALLFLFAAFIDHRAPPLNVIAIVGVIFLSWDPLALTDIGFLLSFGATAGILLAVPAWTAAVRARLEDGTPPRITRVALAAFGLLAATAAAEIALLPVQASAFHRITLAGLLLNFAAIPAMAVVQVAGMAIVALDSAGAASATSYAAAAARLGARALVDSAAIVDLMPALTWRVASPPAWLIALYVLPCGLLAWRRWPVLHPAFAVSALIAASAIAVSAPPRAPRPGWLRLTMIDVGQGEAIAIRLPSGRGVLVDAGGGLGRFDIGDRVLVPALLARGFRSLDVFALTHADVDHVGGAGAIMADLSPRRVLAGIAPLVHRDSNVLADQSRASGASMEELRTGGSLTMDGVLFRVLHPAPPEWERQRVRNDDSLVMEVVFGSVSVLLTGDAGEAVEAGIAAQLAPARLRILKVGHHGSRTSTSRALLDAARPVAALISAGRGNFYGHPAPAVLERLRAARAAVFRTDVDGQIDVASDGRQVVVRTHTGRVWAIAAR